MRRLHQAVLTTVLLGLPAAALAQEPPAVRNPPSAEDMQKSMDTAMGSMVPMMAKMTEATVEAQLRIAEKPETAARIAPFKHNLDLELQKQGFTPTQALQITLNTPLPSGTGGVR